jgi:hypothetical protein
MDRVNIGNARLYDLEKDLGMTGNMFQIAVSILVRTLAGNTSPSMMASDERTVCHLPLWTTSLEHDIEALCASLSLDCLHNHLLGTRCNFQWLCSVLCRLDRMQTTLRSL